MASTGWARFAHRFGQYYRTSTFWRPPRMPKREWMFIHLVVHRHYVINHSEVKPELRQFLSERAMHSCFYSTAYWQKPYELKMDDKGWQGADLIFDLDGDHLPGVTDRDFPAMLDVIRDQAHMHYGMIFSNQNLDLKNNFFKSHSLVIEAFIFIIETLHSFISILRLEENLFRTYVAKALMSKED